jgi:hypothetical protein
VDRLTVRKARKAKDGHALMSFRCLTGDEQFDPWVREVEEYFRDFALKDAHHVIIFEDAGSELAGVSAFKRQDITFGRARRPGWRLQVVALSLPWQGKWVESDIEGCDGEMKASEYALRSTFRRMLEIDDRRELVVGRVHDGNVRSMVACARVGLDRTHERELDEYWGLLGYVDPCAGPT